MSLPPLAPIPNLKRLLTPEETLLYTVRFHPLRGWPFLLGSLLSLGISYLFPPTILFTLLFAVLWYIPLMSNEVAVTNDRLLVRIREATSVREITLNWVWHPMTFLEALQAMQDEQFQKTGQPLTPDQKAS